MSLEGIKSENIKAVIFDMDGLMFDTEALNMKGWIHAGTQHGHTITEDHIRAHIGSNLPTTKKLMQEQFGPGFDFDAIRKERIDFAFNYIKAHGMPLKPGLKELLNHLKANSIKTAIATSSEERFVRYYLEHARLDHNFDVIVCGDQVKRSKPFPDIFLLAAAQLALKPENCVVLEDSYNGVLAAHQAGIRVIMIPDLLPPTPEIEKLCFKQLQNLCEVIPYIA